MPRDRLLLWILAGAGVLLALSRTRAGGAVMDKLVDLIHREEGLRLEAYRDFAGYWTIGYGHKILPGEGLHPHGPRRSISEAEARALLERDMATARQAVASAVTVPLNANQAAALTSLAYNIGAGAFRGSTLVKKLNAGDVAGAAAEFGRWIYAGGSPSQVLVGRRSREASLFASPETNNAQERLA